MTAPHTVAGRTAGIADVLDAAADLLTPEGAWTQGATARASDGVTVKASDPEAVCFCVRGALFKSGVSAFTPLSTVTTAALGFRSATDLTVWNDAPGRTQAEVVVKLREAATAARQSGEDA